MVVVLTDMTKGYEVIVDSKNSKDISDRSKKKSSFSHELYQKYTSQDYMTNKVE